MPQTRRSFTGQYLDETGLLFYNARYYDPAIGRFISADTIVSRPNNPQELNRYSYANNNPLRSTDPSGHCVWDGCVLEFGIAVALIVAIAVIAADSGGRHAAANPIPWCRYLNCLGDGSSPQRMLRLVAALEQYPADVPIWATRSWFGLVFSTTPDHANVVIRADPGADGYDLTFPRSLLRPTLDGAVRTQHLGDPDAAAAAIVAAYREIVAIFGHAPLP